MRRCRATIYGSSGARSATTISICDSTKMFGCRITAHCVTFANPDRAAVIRSHTVPRRGEAVASVTYTSGNTVVCVIVFIKARCSRDCVTVDFTVREGCQCITVFDVLRKKKKENDGFTWIPIAAVTITHGVSGQSGSREL